MIAGATKIGGQALKFLGQQGRNVRAGMLKKGREQMRQPLPSYVPQGGALTGGLMNAMATGAATGNLGAGLGVGAADALISQAGARVAQQGLSSFGPYAASMIPTAQMGVNLAASVGVPLAVESMIAQGQTPQRKLIEQQLAARPHHMLTGQAPGSMYQEQGMPY